MASQFPNGLSVHDGSTVAAGVAFSGTSMAHQPASGASASGYAFNLATGAATASAVAAQDGGDLTLSAGTSAGDHVVLAPNSTDGEVQCSSRPITGASAVTASGAVTGGSLTDGTATLSSGTLSSAVAVTASGAVTGGSLTDGTATLSSGTLSSAVAITASGAVTGGSLTDGTATLSSGTLSSAVGVAAADGGDLTLSSGTSAGDHVVLAPNSTDGEVQCSGRSITGALNITATGAVSAAGVSSSADVNLNSNRITNLADPTSSSDAANKLYVDTEVGRIHRKQPAETVVTSDLSATYNAGNNTLTADANGALGTHNGVALADDDIVLVSAQSDAWANGLYTVTDAGDGASPFILTRTDDMSEGAEVEGALVHILGGTYVDTEWRAAVGSAFVMHDEAGDGDITFAQIQTNFVTAGAGLSKSGTSLAVATGGVTNAMLAGSIAVSNTALAASFPLALGGDTLSFNHDPSNFEVNGGSLRIKDGGVITAELADDAVTEAKIDNAAVTSGKLNLTYQAITTSTNTGDFDLQAGTRLPAAYTSGVTFLSLTVGTQAAPRTIALPDVPNDLAGFLLVIVVENNATNGRTLTIIAPSGSDTLVGTPSALADGSKARYEFLSTGIAEWTFVSAVAAM